MRYIKTYEQLKDFSYSDDVYQFLVTKDEKYILLSESYYTEAQTNDGIGLDNIVTHFIVAKELDDNTFEEMFQDTMIKRYNFTDFRAESFFKMQNFGMTDYARESNDRMDIYLMPKVSVVSSGHKSIAYSRNHLRDYHDMRKRIEMGDVESQMELTPEDFKLVEYQKGFIRDELNINPTL